MKEIRTRAVLSSWLAKERAKGKRIGFVPTMGALHAGHMSLAARARAENDIYVCSVFVNPKQFNNPADLAAYPRTLESDLEKLARAGCDAVFCPDVLEMYPDEAVKRYDFGHLDKVMEGKFRPGHFNGVAVVVDKLFEMVKPDRAYFGRKDFQQLRIVREMAALEGHETEIVSCPTEREDDGLAMSSRNVRLTEGQRKAAPRIFKGLMKAREMFSSYSLEEIKENVVAFINRSPELQVEYFDIVCENTLLPAVSPDSQGELVACIAVYAGEVRLIDNLSLNS
ncbi:MAG: pantoate--beta-alanine ligase [Bacteroidia bacterium]|nr:MAG: pantoate--beta-alanine ligase [Bacteroidia bacterium]